MFFSFDGVDGSGKSTQVSLFVDWLRGEEGLECFVADDEGLTYSGHAQGKRELPIASFDIRKTSKGLAQLRPTFGVATRPRINASSSEGSSATTQSPTLSTATFPPGKFNSGRRARDASAVD